MVEPGRLVDRGYELGLLEELWRGGEPGLVVVYGRRRIGKTRLLLEWARGKRIAYYQAGLWSHEQNLEGLVEAVAEQLGLAELRGLRPRGLRDLFRVATRLLGGERAGIVIDEFTYWVRIAEPVAADLQWVVDHVLPSSRLVLVVSGSLVGVVERALVGGGAPLYGRARLRLRLGELPPWCLGPFAPRYSAAQLVELYALLGGIPHYLRLVDDSLEPLEAWQRLMGPGGVLQDEPLFTMREEFRDPHPYLALAKALAPGPTSLGKAAEASGMPTSHASRYMRVLVDLGLAEEIPLLFRRRRRLYRLRDKALRSWLLLATPAPPSPKPSKKLLERYQRLVADTWEELAAIHASMLAAEELGTAPDTAGKLLSKGEEIDWVIVSHEAGKIIAIEAKWASLDPGEAETITRRVEKKLARILPRSLLGYDVKTLVYAKECKGCPPNVVTADQLPWNKACR